jgi:hypothetical protein
MATNENDDDDWFEGDESAIIDASFKDYQITATPNDFNVKTICDFIDSGVVKIPTFQRHYVWDIERASKLIESLLIGLPIPQIFLYEEARNSFLVIDGQQRLMSIYYFFKSRFPRKEKRLELRQIFAREGNIPELIFADDAYFSKFNLNLPRGTPGTYSRFHGTNYATLGEYQTSFNLSTIRNVVIKQTSPTEDDDSSVFEIFNRLNTGGVNLAPQEIRASLYASHFMSMLDQLTFTKEWLHVTGKRQPHINLKDTEVLLRAFAMLVDGNKYREPIGIFLNAFSKKAKTFTPNEVSFARDVIMAFLKEMYSLPRSVFSVTARTRFNIAFFEAAFRVLCERAYKERTTVIPAVPKERFESLRLDEDFLKATRFSTGQATNVKLRFEKVRKALLP